MGLLRAYLSNFSLRYRGWPPYRHSMPRLPLSVRAVRLACWDFLATGGRAPNVAAPELEAAPDGRRTTQGRVSAGRLHQPSDDGALMREKWGCLCRSCSRRRGMPRRLSRPARQVWRFGKAFASTGAERTSVREHPRAAKTKPKPKIAGRAGSLRYRGWTSGMAVPLMLEISGMAVPSARDSRHCSATLARGLQA